MLRLALMISIASAAPAAAMSQKECIRTLSAGYEAHSQAAEIIEAAQKRVRVNERSGLSQESDAFAAVADAARDLNEKMSVSFDAYNSALYRYCASLAD